MTRHGHEVDGQSGCWNWTGPLNRYGYPQRVRTGSIRVMPYRLYFERAKGPVPEGMQLDHLCRNRRCVNPDHLEAVTAVENARRKPVTVITPETASAIRRLRSEGLLMRVIASRFGVSRPTVSLICSGKTWQEDR